MFDITVAQLLRDVLIIAGAFATMSVLAVLVLMIRRWRQKQGGGWSYIQQEFKNPYVFYTVLTLGLFFSVYGTRLVVVRMVLALCYAFVIARIFLKSDPR